MIYAYRDDHEPYDYDRHDDSEVKEAVGEDEDEDLDEGDDGDDHHHMMMIR